MDPQHRVQWIGLPPDATARVMRLDQRLKPLPRHHAVHLGQERLPPRHFALLPKTIVLGETALHPNAPPGGIESQSAPHRIEVIQSFLSASASWPLARVDWPPDQS